MTRDQIREVFLAHGFTIKDGLDDLKPYVYEAAEALIALASQPLSGQQSLRDHLQQKCSDWKAYWRAPDAHGVVLTSEQALELLGDALGVEVEIVATLSASPVAMQQETEGHAVAWIKPLSVRCLMEAGENGAVTTILRRTPKPGDIGLRVVLTEEIIHAEPWLKADEVRERLEGE